ncbi:unnamed protein product [Adineta steineri]|uniref:G-protein coupled receptors family 1 profile domain-containing protein n=1 Tax=Adineta steineri TaxID=433720 RepID=A0A818WE00_9BILA|nr:unnamed protein product [Adineta steineri]
MSTVDNSSNEDLSIFDVDTQQFYSTQFWVFLFLIIPSLIGCLFALYHLLLNRNLRRELHNYAMIILLIINLFYSLTNISCFIHYFRTFETFTIIPVLRLIWGYVDWQVYVLQFLLYAWITIERHILIFHDQLISTRKKRIFFHYFPPFIIILYCLLYYTLVYFASQCVNNFDHYSRPGFFSCAFYNTTLFLYDLIVHGIVPTFTIIISSIALLIRVLWQKYYAHRQIQWRRYRKMTIQLLIISFLYLILPFPTIIISFLHLCGIPSYIGAEFSSRMIFVSYYTFLFFPIFTIGSLPELRAKLKKILQYHRQRNIIRPINFTTARTIPNRVNIQ